MPSCTWALCLGRAPRLVAPVAPVGRAQAREARERLALHLVILMPVYNEAALLRRAVERVAQSPCPVHEGQALRRTLVLVDDGSSDGTSALVREAREWSTPSLTVHPVLHERNRGKGAAVRTALGVGLELGADVLLIHDADLEYDPADHARLVAPILDGRADAVIGSRFLGDTHRVLYFWHSVVNKGLTLLSNVLTNLNLTDIECCLKAFSRTCAMGLRLREERFGIEPEIVAKVARLRLPDAGPPGLRGARVYEVGVSYAGRTYAEGKKIGWRDGLSAVRCIVRYGVWG
jgi:glycosyltransferase involved in cell wall biosynthesis